MKMFQGCCDVFCMGLVVSIGVGLYGKRSDITDITVLAKVSLVSSWGYGGFRRVSRCFT